VKRPESELTITIRPWRPAARSGASGAWVRKSGAAAFTAITRSNCLPGTGVGDDPRALIGEQAGDRAPEAAI
jgi:hypothetical protein